MKSKFSAPAFAAFLLIGGASLVLAQKKKAPRTPALKAPRTPAPVDPLKGGHFEKVPLPDEAPPSPEELAGGQLMRDQRLLNQVVLALDFASLAAQPSSVWVVAQFKGIRDSSVLAEYDPKTRTIRALETLEQAEAKARVVGEYRIVAALTRAPQQMRAPYSWKAAPVGLSDETWENGLDFLFGSTETLICRINGTAQGRERFGPFTIIPSHWAPFVKPAFDFYRANLAVFAPAEVTAHRTQLTALLNDPNPFLTTLACRTLARAGQLDATALRAAINRATGLQRAALIAASGPALNDSSNTEAPSQEATQAADDLVTQLSGAVQNAANAETLKPLALGIASLFERAPFDPFEPKQSAEWKRARRLLEAVRLKGRSFKTKTAADAYVAYLTHGLETFQEGKSAAMQATEEDESLP